MDKLLFSLETPSETFWETYSHLWRNSAERSPFQAPHLLRYLAAHTSEAVYAFVAKGQGALRGAVLLKRRGQIHTFLSDLRTDENAFVFDRTVTTEEQRAFSRALLRTLCERGRSVELNHQVLEAAYLPLLFDSAREQGLWCALSPHSVCPMAVAATPAELGNHFSQNQRYRYYANRLRTQARATFCVHTDDRGVSDWARAYCETHIRRWAQTATPSAFRIAQQRTFFLNCLRAWHADALCARFSLCLPDGRPIALAVGLLQPPALIFHTTTFDPEFARYSPGKALIYHIAQWMSTNNLRILHFGDGNEPYKYDTANSERRMGRVFVCTRENLPFRAKAKAFQWLKEHPHMEQFYRLRIKPAAAKIALLVHLLQETIESILLSL